MRSRISSRGRVRAGQKAKKTSLAAVQAESAYPADFRTARSDNRAPLGVIPRQAALIDTLLTCSIERGDIRSMQNYVYNEQRHMLNGIL